MAVFHSLVRGRLLPRLLVALAVLTLVSCTDSQALRPVVATAPPSATETSPPLIPHHVPDVTIAAVGDLMLARRVEALMLEHGATYPLERVHELFATADLVVGNLEGTFTARGTPLAKKYTFRTDPHLAVGLKEAGFHAVSLANNHATDFGLISLEDTRAALDEAQVRAFGTGSTEDDAHAPLLLGTMTGATVALLGFSDIGEVLWAGTRPGVARATIDAVRSATSDARQRADYVVVFYHWGAEYVHEPTSRQRELARAAVDGGADLVLGAHPHVLQPWEHLGNSLVLYSLGNFVFDLDEDDRGSLGDGPFQSAVALVTLSRDRRPVPRFLPVTIDPAENRPRPATADEVPAILKQLGEPPP